MKQIKVFDTHELTLTTDEYSALRFALISAEVEQVSFINQFKDDPECADLVQSACEKLRQIKALLSKLPY
jgi:hypothetical protein